MTDRDLRISAVRYAISFWLLSWFIKFDHFRTLLGGDAFDIPVFHPLFPPFFRDPRVSLAAYLAPLVGIAALIWPHRRSLGAACASVMVVCSAVMRLHINAFNDATFITCFWSGLWVLWFSIASESDTARSLHAPVLAQGMIAFMFLGGFLGKLTEEWWNGEALYHYYFLQKDNFLYPWLRENMTADALHLTALLFSRLVIAGELCLSLLMVVPSRAGLMIACWIMLGIVLISTLYLFSVMGPLMGIALAAYRGSYTNRAGMAPPGRVP